MKVLSMKYINLWIREISHIISIIILINESFETSFIHHQTIFSITFLLLINPVN